MNIANSQHNLVGAEHTASFIQEHLKPGAHILDVGSGIGLLARRLKQCGFKVTAIDRNLNAVSEANDLGSETACISLFDYAADNLFDAILMSRSFHHMQPILSAAAKSRALLKDGGIFMLEDFAAELMDEPTAMWFFGVRAFLEAGGNNQKSRGPKLENGKIPESVLDTWHKHLQGQGVAHSPEMMHALETHFRITYKQKTAYLYRYFLDDVNEMEGQALLEWETRLVRCGAIRSLGLRVIAEKS